MTLFVFESTAESNHNKLFTILGTNCVATSTAWLNLPLMAFIGIIIAVICEPVFELSSQILVGLGYGLLIILSSFTHGLGHIISSRMVNAPATALITTATVYVTYYDDAEEPGSYIHVGRSLGGPLLNLLVGLLAIGLYWSVKESHFLLLLGVVNLVFAGFTMTPIPTLDGSAILRELRNWKSPK